MLDKVREDKMNINELLEPNAKKAVFTFGRFNPPTKGHARLMDVVKNAASGADHYVFTGRTNDPKKNPLEYKDKITFLRAMFPHMNIMDNPKIRTPWEALEELGKQYDEVVMVVGSDRKDDFETQMRPYLKDFGIDKFSIVSSGERDADASDVSGVSASKARALAKAGDFKSFSGTIDGGEKLKQQLYTKVRQGMGIMEMANKPKMPKKPEIKSRDPNWRDMEAIRKSGAAGSHKDKKALDKRGYKKHKGKSYDINESIEEKSLSAVTQSKPKIDIINNIASRKDGMPFPLSYKDTGGASTGGLFYITPQVAKRFINFFDRANDENQNFIIDALKSISKTAQVFKHLGLQYDMKLNTAEATEKSKPIAYVDMDGVLANFFAEYANLAGVTTGNYKDIPPAKTDPTLDKMIGTDFFNRLPKFPTTDKLIQLVTKEFGSYKILSSPLRGDHENSKQQKIKWIQRELAIQPDEIIVVGRKDSYAVQADGTPNILIDDRGKNIEGWRSRGGYGIKYQADEDPLSKVVDGIKEFKEKTNLTEGDLIPFPDNTVVVDIDNSNDYYQLTKDMSDLSQAERNKYGTKGKPDTIISFQSKEIKDQITKDIKKNTGMKTRDTEHSLLYNNPGKSKKQKIKVKEHGGRVVKGINTTADVGVDAIKKQSAKFGFKVTKDGVPPIMAPKNLRRVKRMQEALIKINGSNKNLTLQQQIDLQEIKKGISQMVKEAKRKRSNPAEVPYQNDGGEMSLLTHPGTAMHQKMRATSKPGTEDWFKTWRTLSYLTKGRKNHYMLPVKEELEKLLIKHGIIKENPLQQPQGTQGTQGTVKPNTNNTGIDPDLQKVIGQLDQKAKQDPKTANLISKAFQNVKNFFARGAVTEDPSVQATGLPSASELIGFINGLPADATPEQKHQQAEKYLQGVLAQVSKMQTAQRLSFKQNFDTTLKELATKVATELKKLKSTSPFTNTKDLESQEKLKAKDINSLKNIESKIVTGLSGVFSYLKDIGLIDETKQQAVIEFLQDLIQGVVSFEEVLSSGAGDINAMYMNAVTTQEKSPDYIEAYNSVKEKMWRTVIDIGKGTNMGPGELGLSLILQPASKGGKGDLAFTTTDADGNEVTQTVELKGSLDPKSGARLGLEMGNKTNQVASYQKLLDKYFGKGKVPYKYPIKTAKGKDSTESLNLTVKGINVLNQLISQVPGFQTKKFLVDSILLTLEDGETYRKTVEKNKFLDEAINSDGTIDYNTWVRALTLVQYDLYGGEAGKSEFKTIMVFSPNSTNFRVVKNANEFSQAIKDGQAGKPNGIIVSGGLSFNLDKFAKTPQVGIR